MIKIFVRDSAQNTPKNECQLHQEKFVLDDKQWQAFQEALERPVQTKPHLERLLREPGMLD